MVKIVGFENCHVHSFYSLLDGVGDLYNEYAPHLKKINQQYLVITDHGSMASVPVLINACEKYNLFPIFGIEIYYHPNQPCVSQGETMQQYLKEMSPEERKAMQKSYHMTLWAKNEEGYKNLVRLSSWGYLHGFYYRPRVNWEQLYQRKEGIVVGSGCFACPVGQAFDKHGPDAALEEIKKYHALFGDNYYLEIMLLDFHKQKPYNQFLVEAHKNLNIPLVITQDCHYCKKEDAKLQNLMLAVGSKHTIHELNEMAEQGKDIFEIQDKNLWMKSEEELNEKWESDPYIDKDLFEQSKQNSVDIARKCAGIQLDRSVKLPKFPDEDERLKELVMKGIKRRGMPDTKEYWKRVREEYQLVKEKEFSSYFIIQKMMVDAARRKCIELYGGTGSEAVGAGRGSGAGFLINYLLEITDVDPVKHDLLSLRFLSPARGGRQMQLRFDSK